MSDERPNARALRDFSLALAQRVDGPLHGPAGLEKPLLVGGGVGIAVGRRSEPVVREVAERLLHIP